VSPAPPGNNPVIQPTSSASTAPGQLPSAAGRPSISLPTKQFRLAVEPRRTDVAGIAKLPPLPEISHDRYDAHYESDDSSDLGGAERNTPISLKQMEFSLQQLAKRMGRPNCIMFKKWKKVWVAGFFEKKHRFIIQGQNHLELLRDGPLHWETVVADDLQTFESRLPLKNIDNAEWNRRQWVEMFLKKCVSEVQEARKKGR